MSVDDLEQAKTLIQAHRKFHTILKNMAFWQSEVETIEQLTHAIESLFPGRFASVLLFNAEHSTLHMSGAHTSLPKSFTDKVEGTKIGPKMVAVVRPFTLKNLILLKIPLVMKIGVIFVMRSKVQA